MKYILANPLVFLLSFSTVHTFSAKAQPPTARSLFDKMRRSIDTIYTISYSLDYRNVNGGQEDSIFWSSSRTWARRVSTDTIFGAHLHVRQQSKNGASEYYYDGINAIDIYHQHNKSKDLEKTITVIEPYDQGNGYNVVQSRTTVRGYCEELLSQMINERWAKYLDSMQVKESGEAWLIQWQQRMPADDFMADIEVAIGKNNNLISHIKQNSKWHGVPMTQTTFLKDVVINRITDVDSVTLRQNFPNYSVTYVAKKTRAKSKVASSPLMGTKAKPFNYIRLDNKEVNLAAPKGGYLLLDFWETWCGYCFLAMPKLQKLHEQYGKKGLKIVSVVTENKIQVQKILQSKSFLYPTIFADSKVVSLYSLQGRPRYILIDDRGNIIADKEGNLEQIEQLLAERLR